MSSHFQDMNLEICCTIPYVFHPSHMLNTCKHVKNAREYGMQKTCKVGIGDAIFYMEEMRVLSH